MQTSNRLFDDLARVASGAFNTLSGLREEIETRVRERVERRDAHRHRNRLPGDLDVLLHREVPPDGEDLDADAGDEGGHQQQAELGRNAQHRERDAQQRAPQHPEEQGAAQP